MAFPDNADLLSLVESPFRLARDNPSSDKVGWSLRLTPPLPASWPKPEGALVFAYATALPIVTRNGVGVLTAMDAALVSPPFATVLVRDGQPHKTCVLTTSLQSAGTQGVGPAGPHEIMLMNRRDEIYAELYRAPTRYSDLARDYYLQWLKSSGVIARCFPPPQRRFLADLGAHIS